MQQLTHICSHFSLNWAGMIFVILSYENMGGHSAGFFGLQIVLMMVAIQNTLYVISTGIAYKFLGNTKDTAS